MWLLYWCTGESLLNLIWWDRGSVQAADLVFFLSSNKTNEFNITPNAGYGLVATSNATAVL